MCAATPEYRICPEGGRLGSFYAFERPGRYGEGGEGGEKRQGRAREVRRYVEEVGKYRERRGGGELVKEDDG